MHSFRRILCTAMLFLLIVSALSVGLMEVYFRTEYDFFQDASERDAEAGKVDFIVCGASHAFRAFNPDVIDPILGTHSYNLSGALISMQGRYDLLKEEIARNPVKTVILEVSYNTITRTRSNDGIEGDLYLIARLSGFSKRVSAFFKYFSGDEYADAAYKYVSAGMKSTLKLILGKDREYEGQRIRGYLPSGERTMEFDTDYRSYYHKKSLNMTQDEINIVYLDKIMELCRENNVRVILVTTPISKTFLCRFDNLDIIYSWYKNYAKSWDAEILDFNLYPGKEELFPDDIMFYDENHLSREGADLFSRIFAETLKQYDAGENVKENFFKSYFFMQKTLHLD